jgi:hypothetical protein
MQPGPVAISNAGKTTALQLTSQKHPLELKQRAGKLAFEANEAERRHHG